MPGQNKMTFGAALMATAILASACDNNHDYPGGSTEMQSLPQAAIGVVTVGPLALPFSTNRDRTLVFTFDQHGAVLGRLEGNAVYNSRPVAWADGFVAATGSAVTIVSDKGRTEVDIDEDMLDGTAQDPQTGRTLLWFNSGRPDGPQTEYRNNYVMTGPGQTFHTGSVPGIMRTAGYCGDRFYGVVEDFDAIVESGSTSTYQLYELFTDRDPVPRGTWDAPKGFRALSRHSVCADDGSTLLNLYLSPKSGSGSRDEALALARIDTATGAHTEIPLTLGGYPAEVQANTLARLDNRVYWLATDGTVLSAAADEGPEIRQMWKLPSEQDKFEARVTGTTLAVIDYRDVPTYTEYDLPTGHPTRGPIPLPWLDPVVGSKTEGGQNFYTVTGVSSLPETT